MRLLRLPLFLSVLACVSAPLAATEFPAAAQPQLAATAAGRVYLAYGRGPEIFVARSDDAGATFTDPVRVAALPSLMLGMRRGPRIAAHGDNVTVTAMAGELFAFHSKDAGKTWRGPVLINDVPGSAREGLNGLAIAPDGRLFTTWLDLRDVPGARTQLYASESTDGGATWSPNQLVYRATPGNTVCECCHPSAAFNARGDLAVMWRNGLDGARDMWTSTRVAGAKSFAPATKVGTGTWPLKGCPMDGGALFTVGESFASLWMRDGAIYQSTATLPEQKLATGKQPVACSAGSHTAAVWQQGPDLWWSSFATDVPPTLVARGARFATLVAPAGTGAFLLAYEQGPPKGPTTVIVERR